MKRIAVVEDEVYMREELCDMLQKDGYLVEAITEFEDSHDRYSIVCCDALRYDFCFSAGVLV